MNNIHFVYVGNIPGNSDLKGCREVSDKINDTSRFRKIYWIYLEKDSSDHLPQINGVDVRKIVGEQALVQRIKELPMHTLDEKQILYEAANSVSKLCSIGMYVQAKDLFSFIVLHASGGVYLDSNVFPGNDFNQNVMESPKRLRVVCRDPNNPTNRGQTFKHTASNLCFEKYNYSITELLPMPVKFQTITVEKLPLYRFFPCIDFWLLGSLKKDALLLDAINKFNHFVKSTFLSSSDRSRNMSDPDIIVEMKNKVKRWIEIVFNNSTSEGRSFDQQRAEFVYWISTVPNFRDKFGSALNDYNPSNQQDPINVWMVKSRKKSDVIEKTSNYIYGIMQGNTVWEVFTRLKFFRTILGMTISWPTVVGTLLDIYSPPIDTNDIHGVNEFVRNCYKHFIDDHTFIGAKKPTEQQKEYLKLLSGSPAEKSLYVDEFKLLKLHQQSWTVPFNPNRS